MKHAREDYNRIQDPVGLIPADEPVFLLRGQDEVAVAAVSYYMGRLRQCGYDDGHPLLEAVKRQHAAMQAWPVKKLPDMPAPPPPPVPERVDAVLLDARVCTDYATPRLRGRVYCDMKGRFRDGEIITTSKVVREHPGGIVETRNSVYRVVMAATPVSPSGPAVKRLRGA